MIASRDCAHTSLIIAWYINTNHSTLCFLLQNHYSSCGPQVYFTGLKLCIYLQILLLDLAHLCKALLCKTERFKHSEAIADKMRAEFSKDEHKCSW